MGYLMVVVMVECPINSLMPVVVLRALPGERRTCGESGQPIVLNPALPTEFADRIVSLSIIR